MIGTRGKRVDSWRDIGALVYTYVKQETITPLRGIGRFVGFGIAAATCFTFASLFFILAMLRALQTETGDTFEGDWNWVPYLITLFAALVIAGLSASAIGAVKRKFDKSRKKASK